MAAYIAKKRTVYRVINLSGAWDRVEVTKEWAPWITSLSATPLGSLVLRLSRQGIARRRHEVAYVVMKMPPDHIRI